MVTEEVAVGWRVREVVGAVCQELRDDPSWSAVYIWESE